MDNKTYKCEIKISLPIDEVNLIEKIAQKERKTKGEILLEFLNASPKWIDKITKWKEFGKEVV
ncbi:MAG: hypothetical protein LBB59_04625 [Campylobacteraceae bacterium]|jgi:hypothetical protein|nr:hypothetical protein [Campylobacteraceae bacterium]